MAKKTLSSSLDEIDERLRNARLAEVKSTGGVPSENDEKTRGAMGIAFRIGTEMVAAVIVGAGSGFMIDRTLGTAPWAMLILFSFGAVAALRNVYRAVGNFGFDSGETPPTPGKVSAQEKSPQQEPKDRPAP